MGDSGLDTATEHASVLSTISSFGINMGKNLGDCRPILRKWGIRVALMFLQKAQVKLC